MKKLCESWQRGMTSRLSPDSHLTTACSADSEEQTVEELPDNTLNEDLDFGTTKGKSMEAGSSERTAASDGEEINISLYEFDTLRHQLLEAKIEVSTNLVQVKRLSHVSHRYYRMSCNARVFCNHPLYAVSTCEDIAWIQSCRTVFGFGTGTCLSNYYAVSEVLRFGSLILGLELVKRR